MCEQETGETADEQLKILISELGMSREDAYAALGLVLPEQDNADIARVNSELTPEDILMDMFPNVSVPDINDALLEAQNDVDRASEILLSRDLLKEAELDQNNQPKRRGLAKIERKQRKQRKNLGKLLDKEDENVNFLQEVLKITPEHARQLYWTNGNDVGAAILSMTPRIPLTTTLEMQLKKSKQERETNKFLTYTGYDFKSLPRSKLLSEINWCEKRLISLVLMRDRYKSQGVPSRISELSQEINEIQDRLQMLYLSDTARSKVVISDGNSIDLHGHTLNEAQAIVTYAIRNVPQREGKTAIEFITGAGMHSKRGIPVIKNWLTDYLKHNSITFTETSSSVIAYV